MLLIVLVFCVVVLVGYMLLSNMYPTKNTTQKTKNMSNMYPTKNTTQKTKKMSNMYPTKNTTQKTKK
jgi:hypothetical protein